MIPDPLRRLPMDVLLAIETSADACSCALACGDAIVGYAHTDAPRSHASKLAPMIDGLFRSSGLRPAQLSYVAVSSGPGSYTGLRIGSSTAKGIAFGSETPFIAVPTMEALALRKSDAHAVVVTIQPSRKNEYYVAVFERGKDGGVVRVLPESAVLSMDLTETVSPFVTPQTVVTGLGSTSAAETLATLGTFILEPDTPDAKDVARLAWIRATSGTFEDASTFEPYYLKEFEARKPSRSVFDRLPF